MRLGLTFSSSVPDAKASWYAIMLYSEDGSTPIDMSERDKLFLSSQHGRIEAMAQRLLGDNFHCLHNKAERYGTLDLCVAIGTSSGDRRFDFRSFVGWVDCFALEITEPES